MFTLKIDINNASFEDPLPEIMRILMEEAVLKMEPGTKDGFLLDTNGNLWKFTLTKR
jgi:sugar lactone lactonase YvrE